MILLDGYIGFRFDNGADDSKHHFGWIRAVGNQDESMLSLTQYADESAVNTPFTMVPEPSRLALGAGSLAMYRRKRKQVHF